MLVALAGGNAGNFGAAVRGTVLRIKARARNGEIAQWPRRGLALAVALHRGVEELLCGRLHGANSAKARIVAELQIAAIDATDNGRHAENSCSTCVIVRTVLKAL